jgi:hypothetical protein
VLPVLALALLAYSEDSIHVEERRPLSVVLLAPMGALKVIDASALFAGLSQELKTKTDLDVEALEPERAADCAGSLSCLIDRTRPRSALFLVLSAVSGKQNDRLSATLVDLRAARRELARPDLKDREAKDAAITEHAVLLRPRAKEIAGAEDLQKWLRDLVAVELRPTLEEQSSWEPFGAIALDGLPKGAAIALDGVTLRVLQTESVRIAGVRPGLRTLTIEHPETETAVVSLEVTRGETEELVPVLIKKKAAPSSLREPLFWTGTGAAVFGAGLFVYAIAAAGQTETVCLTSDPASSRCNGIDPLHRSGDDPAGAPRFFSAPGGGLALAPLGYSIFGAGAVWALGALLFGDEREAPWIPLLAGAGLGVLSFALSTVLDGERP